MKDIIPHGIPNPRHFKIAVPPSWVHVPIDRPDEPITVTLEDPKTLARTKVEVVDMWTFTMEEFRRYNHMCLEAYDLPAAKMETILRAKYPEIDQKNVVRFVLLKKL
jgi:uncharacterized protein YqfB (UPF0267 family)